MHYDAKQATVQTSACTSADFDELSAALECCATIRTAFAAADWPNDDPPTVSLAVHQGPAEVTTDLTGAPELSGQAVSFVELIARHTNPGQTLISEMVRETGHVSQVRVRF